MAIVCWISFVLELFVWYGSVDWKYVSAST